VSVRQVPKASTIVAVFDDEFEGVGKRVAGTPPLVELGAATPAS
jgi:hypothetical protein